MIIPFGKHRGFDLSDRSVPDSGTGKRCTKCLIEKEYCEFQEDRSAHANHDGYTAWCKKCRNTATARYGKTNYIKKRGELYAWRGRNPEKLGAINKRSRDKNKTAIAAGSARWKAANHNKVLGYYRTYGKKRNGKLQSNLSARMSRAIHRAIGKKKSGAHWETLVGYTLDQLVKHIEKNFLPGMSWENRSLWHIDHKIPVTAFNFETPEDIDFRRCWALKNLHPLWAPDNIKKSNKVDKPFQPSLCLAG